MPRYELRIIRVADNEIVLVRNFSALTDAYDSGKLTTERLVTYPAPDYRFEVFDTKYGEVIGDFWTYDKE